MASILHPLYLNPTRAAGSLVAGQQLTVTSTATVQLTTALAGTTKAVMFDVQTANVYMTTDGQTPSSSKGHILVAAEKYTVSAAIMSAAKFVATSTTNATIWVSELQD